MEGWDLAINVEYLTFIQMITQFLVFYNGFDTEAKTHSTEEPKI